MINSESLKGKIKHIAKVKNISSQEILQMFFFERFLERLSKSDYKTKFVIKGGLLISSMIGIESRTTMDMDTTVKGIPLKEETIRKIVDEIISVDVGDGIEFRITEITHIREEDDYENFRVHLIADFGKIKNPMKIDMTTGDAITPREILYSYPCMFEESDIKILAYPLETVIAEKYESIIKRNISNTRMRDFYDLYSLYNLKKDEIEYTVLKKAIKRTSEKRESTDILREYKEIIEEIREDEYLKELWKVYIKDNRYADNIDFKDTIDVVEFIANKVNI